MKVDETYVHLPSWMSPEVAHSHEVLTKLASKLPKHEYDVGYFLNSEEPSYNEQSDAPKNRSVWLGLEIDADGTIL